MLNATDFYISLKTANVLFMNQIFEEFRETGERMGNQNAYRNEIILLLAIGLRIPHHDTFLFTFRHLHISVCFCMKSMRV